MFFNAKFGTSETITNFYVTFFKFWRKPEKFLVSPQDFRRSYRSNIYILKKKKARKKLEISNTLGEFSHKIITKYSEDSFEASHVPSVMSLNWEEKMEKFEIILDSWNKINFSLDKMLKTLWDPWWAPMFSNPWKIISTKMLKVDYSFADKIFRREKKRKILHG